MSDVLLTPSAAARLLEKAEGTVRLYERQGKLPVIRTENGRRLFKKSDLEKFKAKLDAKAHRESLRE